MNIATIRYCRQQWQDAASRAKRRVQIALSSAAEGSRLPLTLKPWAHAQWRYLPGDIANGWWLLFAEILAVLMLFALAMATGPIAAKMSGELDTMALAALARSDPLGLCLEGSTEDVVRRKVSKAQATLALAVDVAEGQGSGFKPWKDAEWGRTPAQSVQAIYRELQRFAMQNKTAAEHGGIPRNTSIPWEYVPLTIGMTRMVAPSGFLWAWPAAPNLEGLFFSSAEAFEAMLKCHIIVGAYADIDLPFYVARECRRCDPSLKTRPLGGSWAAGQPIMAARVNLNNYQGHFHNTSTAWLQAYMSFLTPDEYEYAWVRSREDLAHHGPPDTVVSGNTVWTTTFYFLREGLDGSVTRIFPYPPALLPAGILRIDVKEVDRAPRSVWLEFAQQSETTALCMAQYARKKAVVDKRFNFGVVHSHFETGRTYWDPVGVVTRVWVQLNDVTIALDRFDTGSVGEAYMCAGGVDVSTPNADATLAKLAGYRSAAKSRYKVTLFGTMTDLSYDDVYAVYTAVLGALFGAFALLVTTLFVYMLAILERFACSDGSTTSTASGSATPITQGHPAAGPAPGADNSV